MSEPSKKRILNSRSIEELFESLPPLNSDVYIEYLNTAPRKDLLPEVLVRAYRQLPPNSPGARATLERLFRRDGKRWEFFELVVKLARRQVKRQNLRNWTDEYKDFLQDAFLRILQTLPTNRGALAEEAFRLFCRNEFTDAWRERYGRRGERLGPVRADPQSTSKESDEEADNGIDQVDDQTSLWQALSHNDQSPQIEAIASKVADELEDPFVKAVAQATWFSNQRPKTSGVSKPDRDPPLTEQFPGKSRDQINRALRKADSKLAGALLDDSTLSWSKDLRNLLEKQRNRGRKR